MPRRPRSSASSSTPPADASLGRAALALFDELFPAKSWAAWRALVATLFGLPIPAALRQLVLDATGRSRLPTSPAREAWLVIGRRGGKSRVAAFLAVVFATLKTYQLAPGERGVVLIVAADRKQARVVFNYVAGLLDRVPMLASLVAKRTVDRIDLSNHISIEIATASYKTTRGYTVVAAIGDEVAFWDTGEDAAETDTEIVNAIRPALATTGGMFIAISTPYAATGELHKAFDRYFAKDDADVLVWRAPTRVMNATIDPRVIDRAMADDPSAAAAEWLAEFRADLESLFSRDALASVTVSGRRELPPESTRAYVAFVDPSGGSADSMTLAVAHRDGETVVLDLVREVRPPFSPEKVVEAFAKDLARYRVRSVTGDAYGGEWPREAFRRHGIRYELSEETRSELYLAFLPVVNASGVQLLDDPRLVGQLAGLERRIGRSGRDAVNHRPGRHDDVANAAAGALIAALTQTGKAVFPVAFVSCLKFPEPTMSTPRCALLGGLFTPSDPSCFSSCPGMRAVWPAYEAYRREGGTADLPGFVEATFERGGVLSGFVWNTWEMWLVSQRLAL